MKSLKIRKPYLHEKFSASSQIFVYKKEEESADSLNSKGYIYQNGIGVKQDYSKAMEYYLKSAEKGNSIKIFYYTKKLFLGYKNSNFFFKYKYSKVSSNPCDESGDFVLLNYLELS